MDNSSPSIGNRADWMFGAYCHARLPNAGLGNKLFVWARAHAFASMNHVPLRVTGWTQLQLAPILHGFDFRLYWNYFKRVDQVSRSTRRYADRHYNVVLEPPLKPIETAGSNIYLFSEIPSWKDYFSGIREHRADVRAALFKMLTAARSKELAHQHSSAITVNVRMGDFRQLKANERFDHVGGVRTPLNYFRTLIEMIRKAHGSVLPVEIVTDGTKRELAELLDLPGVSMAPKRSAIVDMLVMSQSKVLIGSAGSTFSYWAGFLGESAFIVHPDHVHEPMRPSEINRNFYEGPLVGPPENWPPLFLDNLKNI
jgi:hypothetical protein